MRNVIFASYIVIYSDASGEEEETDTDVEELSQLISLLDVPTDDQMSASDFVSVDSDAETGHSLTDEEIVELVTATDMDDRDENEDDDSDPHLLSPCLMHSLQFTLLQPLWNKISYLSRMRLVLSDLA
ncbi:uncharacterized protein LOC134196125 [Corticium candelabrum]|uniref:uncharacterized protein LOC134196125 n=1 Tax=Corticium candelabrum TaxID=121492 RepID=UPI002E267E6A|nr:uncharacterized protein LOC134196125 [Corticium candelabrum]